MKNGKSVVDALLAHYVEEEAMFEHQAGAGSNAMATDQACYALIAYDRLLNEENALYDMFDVTFEETPEIIPGKPVATLGLPANVRATQGTEFNAVLTIDQWDNDAGYKLIDFIVSVPNGLSVTGITAGVNLSGGAVRYHLEEATGKLRVVYFDVNGENYQFTDATPEEILFGDINGDGLINAQDALATVDTWLRKEAVSEASDILVMNVNGDSRINTFDALAIVEHFVNGIDYAVVTKAVMLGTEN